MRSVLYGVAAIASACAWPGPSRSVLCSAAAVLAEAAPFAIAGAIVASLVRRGSVLIAYFGCGCTSGPAARSLPAAAVTWLVFGPAVAMARFAGGAIVERLLRPRCARARHEAPDASFLADLENLVPSAILTAIAAQTFPLVDLSGATIATQLAAGAALGFASSPCGIGAVAIAAALHVRAPATCAAFLCVAGLADARALGILRTRRVADHDALAYGIAALALALLAYRRGGALVHPVFAPALAVSAVAALVLAIVFRKRCSPRVRLGPALMLAGSLTSVTVPVYRATETTLTHLFAGEELSFTGALTTDGRQSALVRYAITCCRADAAPVVVRLGRALRFAPNSWLRVDGVVVDDADGLRLSPRSVTPLTPPSDPFLYR